MQFLLDRRKDPTRASPRFLCNLTVTDAVCSRDVKSAIAVYLRSVCCSPDLLSDSKTSGAIGIMIMMG